jgi:hypothetical protein
MEDVGGYPRRYGWRRHLSSMPATSGLWASQARRRKDASGDLLCALTKGGGLSLNDWRAFIGTNLWKCLNVGNAGREFGRKSKVALLLGGPSLGSLRSTTRGLQVEGLLRACDQTRRFDGNTDNTGDLQPARSALPLGTRLLKKSEPQTAPKAQE